MRNPAFEMVTAQGVLTGPILRLEGKELLKRKGRSLVLILVLLAVLALVGCGSPTTKVSADEVVQNALAAQAGVNSSHVQIDLDATVGGTSNGSALNVTLSGAATGDIDWANKRMKSHVGVTVGYNGMPITITADMYALDNTTYTQTTMLGTTDNWTKSSLPMDFWFTQENSQFMDNLLQSTEAASLPNDKVGDTDCYVLQLKPDIAAIQQMLSQQSSELSEVPDISKLIQDPSFKVWVAKDTNVVTKIEIVLSAHLTPEALGQAASSDVLDIGLTLTVQVTNINTPVSVELPAAAQNAKEGSGLELPTGMFGF